MNKKRYIKGSLRRSDYIRVVLTDTSPYEVPIIVSSDGFYRNLIKFSSATQPIKEIISALIFKEPTKRYTVPYRYKIKKDAVSLRQLSLLHPSAQYSCSQFYEKHDSLITYYCSKGSFSLRRPSKNGSTFFFKSNLADLNKYKGNRVDTDNLEKFIRNPASFFSYAGVDRLYKFFSSSDFLNLEKKFRVVLMLDISKCFSSIYTHSISWALKGSQHSKDNTKAVSFGNDFDRLMQRMNFNETNGICIGPEISRIFAEVILNNVDSSVVKKAARGRILEGRDFECRRYVDDIYIFANDEITAEKIKKLFSECLIEYNLYLNEEKSELMIRPFQTKKSHTIGKVGIELEKFFSSIFEVMLPNSPLIPKKIFRRGALLRSFVSSIKGVCHENNVGYEVVSNYVISSLVKRIELLIDGFELATTKGLVEEEKYFPALISLLEAVFYFFTVEPAVPSSFHVSRSIIIFWRFLEMHLPTEKLSASSQIQRWVFQLSKVFKADDDLLESKPIRIEFLNIVLAVGEVDRLSMLREDLIREIFLKDSNDDYFGLVSCLFFISDIPKFNNIRLEIEKRIIQKLDKCRELTKLASDAYLFLDSICCPFLSMSLRVSLLKHGRAALGLSKRSNAELAVDISELERTPWFVQWQKLDILNMVKKKELSSVY